MIWPNPILSKNHVIYRILLVWMNILFHLQMKLKLHALICDEKKIIHKLQPSPSYQGNSCRLAVITFLLTVCCLWCWLHFHTVSPKLISGPSKWPLKVITYFWWASTIIPDRSLSASDVKSDNCLTLMASLALNISFRTKNNYYRKEVRGS